VLARIAGALFLVAAVFTWISGFHARAVYLVVVGVGVIVVLGRNGSRSGA
jgi:hypothetical protein